MTDLIKHSLKLSPTPNDWDTPPLVLVVEDNDNTQALLKHFLERAHMKYAGSLSPIEALDFLESNTPELILLDIQMPQMDGIELCSRIRRQKRFEDTPIIFLTGMKDMATMNKAFEVGASDYIAKPIRQVEVAVRAKRHILELRKKKEALSQIESLNTKNEKKDKFLGIATHTLRNPVVSIRGLSQFLASKRFGELNPEQGKIVSTIVESSETMLALMDNLSDASKLESQPIKVVRQEHSLSEIAQHALESSQAHAELKDIRLQLEDNSSQRLVLLDKMLIARIVDNLLSNAIKFSPRYTTITLRLYHTEQSAAIAVEDQGPGIPKDEFDRLFCEFGTTSNQPTGGESSSGLGLYLSHRIAQSHGARLSAANLPHGGACFTLELPRG